MNKQPHVLVVDDNKRQAETLSWALGMTGCVVEIALSGLEAIAKVKGQFYDVIFMDIKMPDMNGVDAYKRIKAIRPESVVMLITAYEPADLIRRGIEEGARGVIYKPLDIPRMADFAKEPAKRGNLTVSTNHGSSGVFVMLERHDGRLNLLDERVRSLTEQLSPIADLRIQIGRLETYSKITWGFLLTIITAMIGVAFKVFSAGGTP